MRSVSSFGKVKKERDRKRKKRREARKEKEENVRVVRSEKYFFAYAAMCISARTRNTPPIRTNLFNERIEIGCCASLKTIRL